MTWIDTNSTECEPILDRREGGEIERVRIKENVVMKWYGL